MREFASVLYNTKAWQHCREAYMKKVGGLCERCLKKGFYTPAEIVHHKTWLTPENISDPNITLNFKNLEALCRQCHEEEHSEANRLAKMKPRRYVVDEFGRVSVREDTPPVQNKTQ